MYVVKLDLNERPNSAILQAHVDQRRMIVTLQTPLSVDGVVVEVEEVEEVEGEVVEVVACPEVVALPSREDLARARGSNCLFSFYFLSAFCRSLFCFTVSAIVVNH